MDRASIWDERRSCKQKRVTAKSECDLDSDDDDEEFKPTTGNPAETATTDSWVLAADDLTI